jgi:hypothetical protein
MSYSRSRKTILHHINLLIRDILNATSPNAQEMGTVCTPPCKYAIRNIELPYDEVSLLTSHRDDCRPCPLISPKMVLASIGSTD